MCTEAAGVPGVETGQQNAPQSGSALADKVVTQPRGADIDSTHMWKKHSVLQSHPPHCKCSVASCGQVPGCWTEQMFEKSCHHRKVYWPHSRSLKGCRENACPGRLCMCCVNPSITEHFVFFASIHWSKGFEHLVPFKLSTGGTMWLGSPKWRAEG